MYYCNVRSDYYGFWLSWCFCVVHLGLLLCVLPQVVMLSSVTDLLRYIDENQLTSEFGGTLEYCHSDWIVLRTVNMLSHGVT